MVTESEILKDPVVLSIGSAILIAKEQAHLDGHDTSRQRLLIHQRIADDQSTFWHVEFAPIPPPGLTMRGGGYFVEVNETDGSIRRALFTQ